MPTNQAKSTRLDQPVIAQIDNVGDGTRYTIVAAGMLKARAVFCTVVAGEEMYSITAGGIIPFGVITEFEKDVIEWAKDPNAGSFQRLIFSKHYYNYLHGKQQNHVNQWNLLVALIVAMLYARGRTLDETCLRLIGHLYHNEQEDVDDIVNNYL